MTKEMQTLRDAEAEQYSTWKKGAELTTGLSKVALDQYVGFRAGWNACYAATEKQSLDFNYLIGQLLSCVERAEGFVDNNGPIATEADAHVRAWRNK